MTGLSDVWSAIRNTSASQLGHLIDALSLEHGQSLAMACAQVRVITELQYFPRITILTVAQVCTDSSATWQAKEGALQGVCMMSLFHEYHTLIPTQQVCSWLCGSSSGWPVEQRVILVHLCASPAQTQSTPRQATSMSSYAN